VKRVPLRGVTLLTLAATGVSLYVCGWFRPCQTFRYARNACAIDAARPDDPLATQAGARYRAQQTRHWRQLMYQK
jgi:hypothetical protein